MLCYVRPMQRSCQKGTGGEYGGVPYPGSSSAVATGKRVLGILRTKGACHVVKIQAGHVPGSYYCTFEFPVIK